MHDDVVAFGSIADGGAVPAAAYRLRMTGPDTAEANRLWSDDNKGTKPFGSEAFPVAWGKYRLGSKSKRDAIIDVTNASTVGLLPKSFKGVVVLAGHYLIGPTYGGNNTSGRARPDRKAMLSFMVMDVADPTSPRLVSENNLLGFEGPPVDHLVGTYLKDLDPMEFAGVYRGTPSHFGVMMGGTVPHGDRLYIRSAAFLYCIELRPGEAATEPGQIVSE